MLAQTKSRLLANRSRSPPACLAARPPGPPASSNFLNHSNARLGGAAGFRLRNLGKLGDTRSQDGRQTLLTWIARRLAAADPPAPVLASEVPHLVSPRLRVSVDEAAGALAALEAGLAAVNAELQRGAGGSGGDGDGANGGSEGASAGSSDGPASSLRGVAADLERRLGEARELLGACRDGFAALAAYYGESTAALASEQELWLPLQQFVDRFSAAQRAVLEEARQEAERLRRQASSGGTPGSSRRPSLLPRSASASQAELGSAGAPAAHGGVDAPAAAEQAAAAVATQPGAAAPPSSSAGAQQQEQPAPKAPTETPVADPTPPRPASAARQLQFASPPGGASAGDEAADAARLQQLLEQASSEDDS